MKAVSGIRGQADELNRLLEMHVKATGSQKAREILEHFSEYLPKFGRWYISMNTKNKCFVDRMKGGEAKWEAQRDFWIRSG